MNEHSPCSNILKLKHSAAGYKSATQIDRLAGDGCCGEKVEGNTRLFAIKPVLDDAE